ncbi:unnamed protein product, partial [Polarella glacialis]
MSVGRGLQFELAVSLPAVGSSAPTPDVLRSVSAKEVQMEESEIRSCSQDVEYTAAVCEVWLSRALCHGMLPGGSSGFADVGSCFYIELSQRTLSLGGGRRYRAVPAEVTCIGDRWLRLQFKAEWLLSTANARAALDLVVFGLGPDSTDGPRALAAAEIEPCGTNSTSPHSRQLAARWLTLERAGPQLLGSAVPAGRVLLAECRGAACSGPMLMMPAGIHLPSGDDGWVPTSPVSDSALALLTEVFSADGWCDGLLGTSGRPNNLIVARDFRAFLSGAAENSSSINSNNNNNNHSSSRDNNNHSNNNNSNNSKNNSSCAAAAASALLEASGPALQRDDLLLPCAPLLHWLAIVTASQLLGSGNLPQMLLERAHVPSGLIPLPAFKEALEEALEDAGLAGDRLFDFLQSWEAWSSSQQRVDCVAFLGDMLNCNSSFGQARAKRSDPSSRPPLKPAKPRVAPSLHSSGDAREAVAGATPAVVLEITNALHIPLVRQKAPNTFISYGWLLAGSEEEAE